jgi:hypothetical protein
VGNSDIRPNYLVFICVAGAVIIGCAKVYEYLFMRRRDVPLKSKLWGTVFSAADSKKTPIHQPPKD